MSGPACRRGTGLSSTTIRVPTLPPYKRQVSHVCNTAPRPGNSSLRPPGFQLACCGGSTTSIKRAMIAGLRRCPAAACSAISIVTLPRSEPRSCSRSNRDDRVDPGSTCRPAGPRHVAIVGARSRTVLLRCHPDRWVPAQPPAGRSPAKGFVLDTTRFRWGWGMPTRHPLVDPCPQLFLRRSSWRPCRPRHPARKSPRVKAALDRRLAPGQASRRDRRLDLVPQRGPVGSGRR